MSKIESYVNEVLKYIVADENMKNRIKDDLILQLNEAAQNENIETILSKMGSPEDVAKEFMDSIYENKSEIIDSLIKEHTKIVALTNGQYEYRSKFEIFGIPLVHIKMRRRRGKPCVAKGIIAIGDISIGVISIGGLSIGVFSLGGAALGICSLGGIAIGGLLAFGGIAIGALALGGLAIGLGAIGGFSLGEIALGGYARGTVAIGDKVTGKYTMVTNHISPESREAVYELIKSAYPNLSDKIADFFTSISVYLAD